MQVEMLAIAAAVSGAVPAASAQPLPSLLWRDVREVSVLCLVAPDPAAAPSKALRGRREVQAMLCGRVMDLAAAGAPYLVTEMGFGEPSLMEPDRVTLLVHGTLEGEGADRRLLFTIRPYRATGPDTDVFFGSAPRSVPLGPPGQPGVALDSALASALSVLLPWRASRGFPLKKPKTSQGENE